MPLSLKNIRWTWLAKYSGLHYGPFRLRLVQLLCERRHALLAVPYDPRDLNSREAVTLVHMGMRAHGLDYECGMCGSRELHCEDRPTLWRSLEEASGILARLLAENLQTRLMHEVLVKRALKAAPTEVGGE